MCRIAGIITKRNSQDARQIVTSMLSALQHGGPDDEGVFQHGGLTLGHRRLSIIDLTASGHQPMIYGDGELVLSYNGEVYNYRELRSELVRQGLRFQSNSDTEVILQAYRHWGSDAFRRFRGIFAFALFDVFANKLLLVRDYPGVKPMYIWSFDDQIVFASEAKSFCASGLPWKEDTRWKATFLAFGYLPHPITTIDAVRPLQPGCFLEIDTQTLAQKQVSYFTTESLPPLRSVEEGLLVVRQSVEMALKRNLVADAPLGVFLSGGVDSSLLTSLAAREVGNSLVTVSVNFSDAEFDEKPYQSLVIAKTGGRRHTSVTVDKSMMWQQMPRILDAMDQPTIDGVNSYFVSQAAHDAGLKAVLSGLGADELFAGYQSSHRAQFIPMLRRLPAKVLAARLASRVRRNLARVCYLSIEGAVGDALFLRGIFTPEAIAQILDCTESEIWNTLSAVPYQPAPEIRGASEAMTLEYDFYMKGQLLKDTDVMSMRFALEARVPFLDADVISQAARLASLYRQTKADRPKYFLTKAFEDVLPPEIVFRKKQGFTFPFKPWLAEKLESDGAFLSPRMRQVLPIQEFKAGKTHWSQVWAGAVLEKFRVSR